YICHVYVNSNNVGAVVIADHEYPQRVAHTLLNKVIEEFEAKVDKKHWSIAKEDTMEALLERGEKVDELVCRSTELSDTSKMFYKTHNTIEAVLERGEKIDDLVEKSEGLSLQSKTFYK
ncbi:YKT6-like protein, partial [Mya arenaria]